MSVSAQIIMALDPEAVRYIANTTCSIKGALLPRKMFPDFPLGGAENGTQCVNLCSAVEGAGSALFYAPDAWVNHSAPVTRETIPYTSNFIPSTHSPKKKGFCECRVLVCAHKSMMISAGGTDGGQHVMGNGGGIYVWNVPLLDALPAKIPSPSMRSRPAATADGAQPIGFDSKQEL